MPITWKKKSRFNPTVILKKIESVRTVNPAGGIQFAGFELEDCLPALQSMLVFPTAAVEVETSTLVWSSIAKVRDPLTPNLFLKAINEELTERLATSEKNYHLLTAISLNCQDIPKSIQVNGAEINFLRGEYGTRYSCRKELLRHFSADVKATPSSYCRVVVKVKAKSSAVAVNKALKSLDLQRALWCLMGNPRMQWAFGKPVLLPINVVRLGSQHTLHFPNGNPAADGIWLEAGFAEADIFRFTKIDVVKKNSSSALRKIKASSYSDVLISSLVRFVRAFDEREPNTAFLRLWGAVEALATPGQADYDKLIRRCSFLFKDNEYHRQLLEHLREYRNANIHAGEESDRARTHCYQLQLYFANLIWFHISSAWYFRSIDEANEFLDSPSDQTSLNRRLDLIRKAVRFRTTTDS